MPRHGGPGHIDTLAQDGGGIGQWRTGQWGHRDMGDAQGPSGQRRIRHGSHPSGQPVGLGSGSKV